MKDDHSFQQQRAETFDRVIALLDEKINDLPPDLLLRYDEISEDGLRRNAERESWSLFRYGIHHLKAGAPGGQPGSITEALSRTSLRSSALATALGVKPPQFEQMYFGVDYTNGYEAAVFYCRRLADAAEGDLSKSRQIVHRKISAERAMHDAALKRQMVFSFNILAETYARICRDFKVVLLELPPLPPHRTSPAPKQRPF